MTIMLEHVKNYLNHFGYTKADIIFCEICGAVSTDIHHIKYRSQGGSNKIDNLAALCRGCHELVHAGIIDQEEVQEAHDQLLGV